MLEKINLVYFLIGLFIIAGCGEENSRVEFEELTTNMAVDPMGVDPEAVKFGWKLSSSDRNISQNAYQLILARHQDSLDPGSAVWDSGKITSVESQHIAYDGENLEEEQDYFWKLRVWKNEDEEPSAWSETGYFYTAPNRESLKSTWIGAITREESNLPEGRDFHVPTIKKEKRQEIIDEVDSLAKRSIILRKEFRPGAEIQSAKLYISGLGHYELSLNGKKIGESEFAPLWSDYDKTVYYNIYDVTENLQNEENAIGVILGNGMYNVIGERYAKFFVSFGPPTLFFNLKVTYADGSEELVSSDSGWKYDKSPITFNTLFGGEDYDATLEQEGWDQPGFDDSHWKEVVLQEAPKGQLTAQTAPPVKVEEEYEIQEITEPEPGVYVLDMGQNLSGFPSIKVQGEKGQKIRIWVGEKLKEDGTVAQGGSGGPYYYDYTLKGGEEEQWQPRFSYYGYQYVQLEDANFKEQKREDLPTVLDVTSKFVHNSAGIVGSFECSNEIFNQSHELINKAIRSNFHSVFTDCPHREKLGWLEETHLNGPGLFFNYDLRAVIPKLMRDIADAQHADGLIPNIAPEYIVFGGDFTDSPEWGVAGVVLPWMYYQYYGDPSLIEEYYEVMKDYVDYLTSTSEDHIVSHGLGDWYDYGEHAAGYSKNSPIALSATSHYFYGSKFMEKAARMLGKEEDASKYGRLTQEIRNAFNEEFFDPETKEYGTGSQFSNAVPLFMEIAEPEDRDAVMENLLAEIEQRGYRLTTGDVGNRYLFQALARNGENEVMYKMHNHYDAPGYGFQIEFGVTTLTEQWDPRKGNSWNHFMMGQIEEWFYRSLAGIVPDEDEPGFKHFYIQPEVVGDMHFAKATYESIYGRIASNWEKDGNDFQLRVEIPANTTATVRVPGDASSVQINGEDPEDTEYVLEIFEEENSRSFLLGSGEYVIESRL